MKQNSLNQGQSGLGCAATHMLVLQKFSSSYSIWTKSAVLPLESQIQLAWSIGQEPAEIKSSYWSKFRNTYLSVPVLAGWVIQMLMYHQSTKPECYLEKAKEMIMTIFIFGLVTDFIRRAMTYKQTVS